MATWTITTTGVDATGLAVDFAPDVRVKTPGAMYQAARAERDVCRMRGFAVYQVIRDEAGEVVQAYGTPPRAYRG